VGTVLSKVRIVSGIVVIIVLNKSSEIIGEIVVGTLVVKIVVKIVEGIVVIIVLGEASEIIGEIVVGTLVVKIVVRIVEGIVVRIVEGIVVRIVEGIVVGRISSHSSVVILYSQQLYAFILSIIDNASQT